MTKHIFKKFAKDNKLSMDELAKQVGVSRFALYDIMKNRSSKTRVHTCIRIKQVMGFEPWQYLSGLEELEKLSKKQ